jgi:hydroxyacylglutathione hydrolase
MFYIQSFTFSPIQENTYLLWNDDKDCIIIDPGCYHPSERSELADFIDGNLLTPKLLLNTHCHLDHVFGEKFVAEKYGLTPHIHANEKQMLQMAAAAGDMWGMPFENYTGPVELLQPNQEIKLGYDILKVLFTPGHSPGHVCFYCAIQGFVIGGDVLFKGSIGRTDLPGGNFEVLIESIENELLTLPDNTRVFSGHGGMTTIGNERFGNPYLINR